MTDRMTQAPVPAGLVEAFWEYERALMADDVADARPALRARPDHAARRRRRAARRPRPDQRVPRRPRRRPAAPDRADPRADRRRRPRARHRGHRARARRPRPADPALGAAPPTAGGSRAAHVAVPAPALDTRIWRLVGDPLVAADRQRPARRRERRRQGPVRRRRAARRRRQPGLARRGAHRAGARPRGRAAARGRRRRARASPAPTSSPTRLAGTNAHYGTPPNPKAPLRISGGSTSGLGDARSRSATRRSASAPTPAARSGCPRRTRASTASGPPTAPRRRTACSRSRRSFDTVGWVTRERRAAAAGRRGAAAAEPAQRGERPGQRARASPRSPSDDVGHGRRPVRRRARRDAGVLGPQRPADLARRRSRRCRRGRPGRSAAPGWRRGSTSSAPTCAAGSRRPR